MRRPLLLLVVLAVAAPPAAGQVNTERMRRALGDETVYVSLDAAFAVARGNTDFLQVGVGGRVDLQVWDELAFLVGRLDFAGADGTTIVDRSFLHARHSTDLAPRLSWSWETFVQAERNGPQRLRARTLLGAGLRYALADGDSLVLAAGLTPMLEHEVLDRALGEPTTVIRTSSYVTARLTLARATLSATTYLQPYLVEPGDVRVLSQAGVEVGVTRSLRLRVRADVRYDSRPPTGVRPTDVRVENGLVLVIPAG